MLKVQILNERNRLKFANQFNLLVYYGYEISYIHVQKQPKLYIAKMIKPECTADELVTYPCTF